MAPENPEPDPVTLTLSADAAVVLDGFLSRFDANQVDDSSLVLRDPSERAALWELQCALERTLVSPLRPDYKEILARAAARIRESSGV